MGFVGLAALVLWGLIDDDHVPLAFALVPAALLGKLVGTALLERISEKVFREATLHSTLLTGALGLATALWALI